MTILWGLRLILFAIPVATWEFSPPGWEKWLTIVVQLAICGMTFSPLWKRSLK